MNYIEVLRSAIVEELPGLPDQLVDLYTNVGLSLGRFVDNEAVHEAWSIWQNRINPDHPSLIPYHQLSKEKQDLDTKYTEGIFRAVEKVYGNR